MTGLILKDFYSLRTYFIKQLGLMALIYIFLSAVMKNFSFLSSMLTLSGMMMLISSFNVDEAGKWDSYALTLPVTSKAIVGSKYLLFLGTLFLFGATSALISSALNKILFQLPAFETLISTASVVVIYLFMSILILPLFFKLGVEKARIAMTLAFVVPFILFIWGGTYLSQVTDFEAFLVSLPWGLLAGAGVILLLALSFASYLLSVKFHESKEY